MNRPLKITLSAKRIAEQQVGVPAELVKNFSVRLVRNGEVIADQTVTGNHQRHVVVNFEKAYECDKVEIHVTETNGWRNVKIFEVRVYDTAQ